jgi:NAD(P)-dependent dehydrogenase (short-subunit alcohol dehydrogenase family)
MEKLDNGFKRNNEEFTSKTSHLNGVIADLNSRVKSLEEEVYSSIKLNRKKSSAINRFDEIEKECGPIDVLVNNAAGNFPVLAEKMSPNAWRAVTDIVLDGTFFCSTELARRAIASGREAAILNIGATYSWTGGPGTAHSAAAKAGVTNMTMSLAVEWAPYGIRVNCLAPGLFPHDDLPSVLRDKNNRSEEQDAARVPAGRVGRPHELGWIATYMCSPFASYLSGHTAVLDGANWLRRGLRMPDFVPVYEQFNFEKDS